MAPGHALDFLKSLPCWQLRVLQPSDHLSIPTVACGQMLNAQIKKGEHQFVASANFCDVSTRIMADFKPPRQCEPAPKISESNGGLSQASRIHFQWITARPTKTMSSLSCILTIFVAQFPSIMLASKKFLIKKIVNDVSS